MGKSYYLKAKKSNLHSLNKAIENFEQSLKLKESAENNLFLACSYEEKADLMIIEREDNNKIIIALHFAVQNYLKADISNPTYTNIIRESRLRAQEKLEQRWYLENNKDIISAYEKIINKLVDYKKAVKKNNLNLHENVSYNKGIQKWSEGCIELLNSKPIYSIKTLNELKKRCETIFLNQYVDNEYIEGSIKTRDLMLEFLKNI